MKIKMIVAISANGCIGKDGDLVLTHKDDFNHFKTKTKGHNVIMGRKTWDSLPKKPLPDRGNFYITKSGIDVYQTDLVEVCEFNGSYIKGDVTSGDNIKEIVNFFERIHKDKDLWVIGGASIYKQFIDSGIVDEIQVTRWKQEVDGDAFFPELDPEKWVRKYIMNHPSGEFQFETWYPKDEKN